MHRIDTAPGKTGPFAPPADWNGNADAYRGLLRDLWRLDTAARQQMGVVARRLARVAFHGPYAEEAQQVAEAIAQRLQEAARDD